MTARIFDGLRVVDFTWAAAGPILTKQFADNGATVVKIESTRHPDSVRLGGPFLDDKPGLNRSGFFADFNSSKLGLAVDMGHPRAADVVTPLIEWADIVAESFRPGIMAKWGFDYERVCAINPRAIMVSSSLYGADGPWSAHPGYGSQGVALAGIHGLTGWPDRPPAAPKGAYTDSVSPRFGLSALVAALIHRERTGEGQWVELSQIEATVNLITPHLLELQLTGWEAGRAGNTKPGALLHAVLPCRGDDRWIAIETRDDRDWSALAAVLRRSAGEDQLPADAANARAMLPASLEERVAQATQTWDAFDLVDALRQAGVPAGVAFKGSDLLEDPVLRERGHFWSLPHPEMGTLDYNGPAYRFSRTPSELTRAAPCLGEHTDEVLRDILHLPLERIAELRSCGLIQ